MKTKLSFISALLLAISITLPARRASANIEVSTFRLRDKVLLASFSNTDPDGCYVIATSVRYAQSVTQQDGPPVVTPPLTSVEVFYQNFCTGEFNDLTGGTGTQTVHIAGDLGSATLSATVPVSDGVMNATVTLHVTWTANAPLQQAQDSNITIDRANHTITWDRFNVRTRSATPGGTISTVLPVVGGPTTFNLALKPESASLGTDVFGNRVVTFLNGHPH